MNICFIGNSVSAQKNSYREILVKLLTDNRADSIFPINCSLGGIGSLGVSFFINRMVQDKVVDLCFIETFVADLNGATPIEYIEPALRGIVSNACLKNARIIPLMLYRSDADQIAYTTVLNIYREVFESYGLEVANVYEYVADQIHAGLIQSTDVVYDQVHSTAQGSFIYAEFILAWLNQHIEKPLTALQLPRQASTLLPVTGRSFLDHLRSREGQWRLFRKVLPYIVVEQGSLLEVSTLNAGCIGMVVIADSDSGVVHIRYGDKRHSVQIYDAWCYSERLQVVILPYVIPPNSIFWIEAGSENSARYAPNLRLSDILQRGRNIKIAQLMTVDPALFKEG
jgi:hypothetical protein